MYLLGGSALCLLGNPRETLDVDYTYELAQPDIREFEEALKELSSELKLDLESVRLSEFIPLPPEAHNRRRFIGKFGRLDVYIFDLYSIALSKIARGFESDLEDVEFMIRQDLVRLDQLEQHFQAILPEAPHADIDPREFGAYFLELKRRLA